MPGNHPESPDLLLEGGGRQAVGVQGEESDIERNRRNSILIEMDAFSFIMARRCSMNLDEQIGRSKQAFLGEGLVWRRKNAVHILREGEEAYRQGRYAEAFKAFGWLLAGDFDHPALRELVEKVFNDVHDASESSTDLPPPFNRLDIMPSELRTICGLVAFRRGFRGMGLGYLENVRWDAINVADAAVEFIDHVNTGGSHALRKAMAEGLADNPNVSRCAGFMTNVALGALAFRVGRVDMAREVYRRFAGLSTIPDPWNLVRLIHGLVRTGGLDVAKTVTRRLEEQGGDSKTSGIQCRLSLAEAYLAMRMVEDARRLLAGLDRDMLLDASLVVRMAYCFLRSGLVRDGLGMVEKALEIEGVTTSTGPLLALKGHLGGDPLADLALLEEESTIQQAPPYLIFWRIELELVLGRVDQAWDKVTQLDRSGDTFSGLLYYHKAHAQLAQGNPRAAAESLMALISNFTPPDVCVDWLWQVFWEWGLILIDIGQTEEARSVLQVGDKDYQLSDNACPALLRLMEARQAGTIPDMELALEFMERADRDVNGWMYSKAWLYLKAAQVLQMHGWEQMARQVMEDRFFACTRFGGKTLEAARKALLGQDLIDFGQTAEALADAFFPYCPGSDGFRQILVRDILSDCRRGGWMP